MDRGEFLIWRCLMMDVMFAAMLASFVPSSTVAAETPTIGRGVGQVHPQIALPSLDGRRTLALSDFRGKKVILIEYASW